MERDEKELRERLDRTLRMGRELHDHAHYDRLTKERLDKALKSLQTTTDHLTESLEILGRCLSENHVVECEGRRRHGDDPAADIERADLSMLPADQAASLRLVAQMGVTFTEETIKDAIAGRAHEDASAFFVEMERVFQLALSDTKAFFDVLDEKVKRGWMTADQVASGRTQLAQQEALLDKAISDRREALQESFTRRRVLLAKYFGGTAA